VIPQLAAWQWCLAAFNAFSIGIAKAGVPGAGTLIAPLMVLAIGDARHAPAWTAPVLSTGDIFALSYWRRHADASKLLSLVPWVVVGMLVGAVALSFTETVLRRIVAAMVLLMLLLNIAQRRGAFQGLSRGAALYGVAAGFASTVANAAGPIMNLYLLTRKLSKEQFVATGAWFFFIVNLAKLPVYIAYGLISVQSLVFDLLMVPLVICGGFAGLWLIHRIPQKLFESTILVLTAVSVILMLR
jgi:uncharacterized membrane protein YfcA